MGNLPLPPGDSHWSNSNQGDPGKFSCMESSGGEGGWDISMEKKKKGKSLLDTGRSQCEIPHPCGASIPSCSPSMDMSSHAPRIHSQIILPKSHQGGCSKPFSMIPQPLAGPGVELRDGTWGKEWQFQDFQTDVDISPWRGKRGGKNMGNPFFLPKS